MTQREQVRDDKSAVKVGVYETPSSKPAARTTSTTAIRDDVETDTPKDLIRWGSVLGGLFAALATLITLTVLGLAIGLSAFNVGDSGRSFGIGAGVWGAISALIAFGVGGWLAARAAAARGHSNGILNGAMVWFVAIPLLVYFLGSGIGALVGTAGSVAGTAATVAGQAAGAAASNPSLQATAVAGAQGAVGAASATAQAAISQITPAQVNQAADNAANGAWGTLLSLGLAAAAAVGGGYAGARTPAVVRRTTTSRAA